MLIIKARLEGLFESQINSLTKLQNEAELSIQPQAALTVVTCSQQSGHVLSTCSSCFRGGYSWVCQLFLPNLQSQKWLPLPRDTVRKTQREIQSYIHSATFTGRKHQTWEGALWSKCSINDNCYHYELTRMYFFTLPKTLKI